jgi:hypothetical protein
MTDWKVYNSRWEDIWSNGLQPGQKFDATRAATALTVLLDNRTVEVEGKSVIVPGCGRGYDVVEFAKRGATPAVGLELAPNAVTSAQQYIAEFQLSDGQRQQAQVKEGDFFQPPAKPYDLGYDYTFGCAMHPDMRTQWATSWHQWLKPGFEELQCDPVPAEHSFEGRQGKEFIARWRRT